MARSSTIQESAEMSEGFVFQILPNSQYDFSGQMDVYATMHEESLTNYSQFRDELRKFTHGLTDLKYIDEEGDIVSIDTEEEFKELVKFAKQCYSKGVAIRLIMEESLPKVIQETPSKEVPSGSQVIPLGVVKKMKKQIKEELKKELLSEMKKCSNEDNIEQINDDIDYEEDSDGNVVLICEKKKKKLIHKQKKIEKKDKHDESKFDKRLEKLELKKRRLLEKAEQRFKLSKKTMGGNSIAPAPCIMSAIVTDESSILLDYIKAGTTFQHRWRIINDGTVPLNHVFLRHYWSTPGLVPRELSIQCPTLAPGKDGLIPIEFKAPDEDMAFKSYWLFYYDFNGNCVHFGHYVLLKGNAMCLEKSSSEEKEASGQEKQINQDKKTVSFADETQSKKDSPLDDNLRLPCQMQIEVQKKLEATLASSVIAAEMAREAANVAYRRAVECSCAQSSNAAPIGKTANAIEELNKCMEKTVVSMEKLNINCGFDTETNMDNNEDTDKGDNNEDTHKGFVLVDVPSFYQDVRPAAPEKHPIEKENIKESSHSKDNELKSLPGGEKKIEKTDEKNKKRSNSAIHFDKTLTPEQLGATSNVHGPYGLINPNIIPSYVYTPPRNPTYPCSSSRPYYSPSNCQYTAVPPYPTYSNYNMHATSQPLPYSFGQHPTANPFVPMNACNGSSVRHGFMNSAVNRPSDNNFAVNNGLKNPSAEFIPAMSGNQCAGIGSNLGPGAVHVPSMICHTGNSFRHTFTYPGNQSAAVSSTTPGSQGGPFNTAPLPKSVILQPPPTSQLNAPVLDFMRQLAGNNTGINTNVSKNPTAQFSSVASGNQSAAVTSTTPGSQVGYLNSAPLPNPTIPLPPATSQGNAPVVQGNAPVVLYPNLEYLRRLNADHQRDVFFNRKFQQCYSMSQNNTSDNNENESAPKSANMLCADMQKVASTQRQSSSNANTQEMCPPVGLNNSTPKPVKEPGVQILPQALVDGAINVASSAYSTAWNAITHLRPKGDAVEFDPVFENNMALLVEMGFNNLERNARLLKLFNNDVNKVIGSICASGGGDLLLD